MPFKIFVGNVATGTTSGSVNELFAQYGTVTECDILGNFGFVHMSTEAEAKAAIQELNGYTHNGSALSVEMSKKKTGVAGGDGGFVGRGPPDRVGTTKIFIGNIKDGVTNAELSALFETYGTVTEADVCGGFGFVHMAQQSDAIKAIKALKGFNLNGNRLNIELSTRTTQGRSRGGEGGDDFGMGYGGGGLRGRGRGMPPSSMRFDPYSKPLNGGRRGVPDPYAADPYAASAYAPIRSPVGRSAVGGTGAGSGGDSFARDLLDLYLKNPVAFDRYAKDPMVRQSLNLEPVPEPADDPYYRPPREYYESKMTGSELADPYDPYMSQSSMAPIGSGRGISSGLGLSSSGGRGGLGASMGRGGAMRPQASSASRAHLYTSFE